MSDFNSTLVEEFRANGGKVGGPFVDRDMIVLTVTGAKTGQPRVIPLVYTMDGEDYVILASNGGQEWHPAWYFNLLANPRAQAEVGTETFAVDAEILEGAERDRVFDQMATILPGFAEYQERATRIIPTIKLHRVE